MVENHLYLGEETLSDLSYSVQQCIRWQEIYFVTIKEITQNLQGTKSKGIYLNLYMAKDMQIHVHDGFMVVCTRHYSQK